MSSSSVVIIVLTADNTERIEELEAVREGFPTVVKDMFTGPHFYSESCVFIFKEDSVSRDIEDQMDVDLCKQRARCTAVWPEDSLVFETYLPKSANIEEYLLLETLASVLEYTHKREPKSNLQPDSA